MANPEHVEIVKQGAKAIAAWREAHPGEWLELREVDLQGANLPSANLPSANLQGANLQDANLQDANLQDANLPSANLQVAKLPSANLRGAKLRGADLQGANLRGANLQGAYLLKANLQGAQLQDADLQGAYLSGADFSRADINRNTNFDDVTVDNTTKGLGPWVFNPEKYIIREIEFPPEYHQAGVGIMNYFATVLRQKYPDIPATVQIAQEELTVRMTIETDDGHREIIEQTLEEYGLVLSGTMPPEQFSSNPLELAELKSELGIARLRIENQNNLLQIQSDQAKSQETQIQLLGSLLEKALSQSSGVNEAITQAQEMTKLLGTLVRQISRQQNQAVTQAFDTLQAQLTQTTKVDEPAMTEALDTLKEQAPDVFDKFAHVARDVVVGATGNMAYALLQRYFGI